MTPPQFRNMNELTEYLSALETRIVTLESENGKLKRYITDLGGDAQKMLPKTGLLSPAFMQRAFAVWGHYFVAQLIISLVMMCIFFVIGLLAPDLFQQLYSLQ
ncbi:MAG: hypothetical protein FJZ96_02020 [Chloroflexi bacterium]|nr:hypothetical protein [Chloroflexota bacterium]